MKSMYLLTPLILAACTTGGEPTKAPVLDLEHPEDARSQAADIALRAMQGSRRLGVEDVLVRRADLDRMGTAHVRVDQVLGGVPVFGAQSIVHVPADGRGLSITDGFQRDLQVDVRPDLTPDRAEAIARAQHPHPAEDAVVDLQVLRTDDGDHLTWRVQLWSIEHAGPPSMPVVFVDAHRGHVVWQYDNLQTARDRDTHDAENGTGLPGTLVRAEADAATGDVDIDAIHDHSGLAYDYYDVFQARDSWDDSGATVASVGHYRSNYNNAFWNGRNLVYGDGDGSIFDPLGGALDVVAHEFTHAVTGRTAGLIYANESGGLNEATSDIMAAVVESWNDGWAVTTDTWEVGEDVTVFRSALRYMDDPPRDGVSISDYDDYTAGMVVHYSSGIANRAFAEWESDPDMDMEEAGDVWYRALQYYMAPSTTYPEARLATEQAAIDLFGEASAELDAVEAGWDLVDVPAGPRFEEFASATKGSASTGTQLTYQFTAHPNADAVRFTVESPDGDADLYVRYNVAPTTNTFDCVSGSPDSYEICTFNPSNTGTYHVMVDAFSTFTDMTVRAWEACDDLDGDGFSVCEDDCDDTNPDVNPGAIEVCNEIDDNCDDVIDEPEAADASTWFADADSDGFGDAKVSTLGCTEPDGFVADDTDCDDVRKDVNPAADELCDEVPTDEDCDGDINEDDAVDALELYIDGDLDGFGVEGNTSFACLPREGLVEEAGDCDDADVDRNPGVAEVCDLIDNDCNDLVDDGLNCVEADIEEQSELTPSSVPLVAEDERTGLSLGCGCASPGTASFGWLGLGLGVLLVRRRQR